MVLAVGHDYCSMARAKGVAHQLSPGGLCGVPEQVPIVRHTGVPACCPDSTFDGFENPPAPSSNGVRYDT